MFWTLALLFEVYWDQAFLAAEFAGEAVDLRFLVVELALESAARRGRLAYIAGDFADTGNYSNRGLEPTLAHSIIKR